MRWLVSLCLVLGFGCTAAAQSQADLINCTSNLRVTYASPIIERRLTGAVFRDQALGAETLAACAAHAAASDGELRATLFYAYALLASGQSFDALSVLLALEGRADDSVPWADPRRRAFALRATLLDVEEAAGAGSKHPLFADEAAAPTRLSLMRAGLLPIGPSLNTLEGQGAYRTLLAVYSGAHGLSLNGQEIEADLAKLRQLSDAAVSKALGRDDPLGAIRALKTASGFYQRAQTATGIVSEPAQARWRREQALGLGLRGWHEIERDEAYRDALVRETLPLVSTLLETSDTADVLHSIAEAVATDWAGLRTGQGLDPFSAFQAAAEAGSAAAEARLVLARLAQGQENAEDAINTLTTLSQRDACVYDPMASAYRQGLLTGASNHGQALSIYARGQRAGDAGSFFGAGEMRRHGVGLPYDFAQAKALLTQALSQLNLTRCSRSIPARTHLLLGWLEHTGQGGQMDLARAHAHFRSATRWGSFHAAEALAEQYFFGLGVPQDPVLAYDYATKAYLWNRAAHPTLLAFDFYGESGGSLPGIGPDGLPLPPRDQTLEVLSEATQAGQFSAALILGLGLKADPKLRAQVSGRPQADDLLKALASHVGSFERAYDSGRDDEWASMNAALDGQINLAFTAARYDTVAAIAPDPQKALAFYQALPAAHPVAQKMLQLDRFDNLSALGQQRVGQGPITLEAVVEQGLADELQPLPLSVLLSP